MEANPGKNLPKISQVSSKCLQGPCKFVSLCTSVRGRLHWLLKCVCMLVSGASVWIALLAQCRWPRNFNRVSCAVPPKLWQTLDRVVHEIPGRNFQCRAHALDLQHILDATSSDPPRPNGKNFSGNPAPTAQNFHRTGACLHYNSLRQTKSCKSNASFTQSRPNIDWVTQALIAKSWKETIAKRHLAGETNMVNYLKFTGPGRRIYRGLLELLRLFQHTLGPQYFVLASYFKTSRKTYQRTYEGDPTNKAVSISMVGRN